MENYIVKEWIFDEEEDLEEVDTLPTLFAYHLESDMSGTSVFFCHKEKEVVMSNIDSCDNLVDVCDDEKSFDVVLKELNDKGIIVVCDEDDGAYICDSSNGKVWVVDVDGKIFKLIIVKYNHFTF